MQVPAPGRREVRSKVKAIGINRAESMWRNDKYTEPAKFPAGLGYEAAGIVDAVGKDVTDFVVGDAVSTIPAFSLNQYFTYGEVILAPVHAVVKHPESLSFVEAASVWMMFLTAYGALIFDAQVKAGDFVIIPAASSSVGLAAGQIANYARATPLAHPGRAPCLQVRRDGRGAPVCGEWRPGGQDGRGLWTGGSNSPPACAGGCQCGSVRYVLTTDPSRWAPCRCKECQRQSGSAFGM